MFPSCFTVSTAEIRLDYWNTIFNRAKDARASLWQQEPVKKRLHVYAYGSDSRMFELCDRYFTLKDILDIVSREIGTGFIGGKSVGIFLRGKILEMKGGSRSGRLWSPMILLPSVPMFLYIVYPVKWLVEAPRPAKNPRRIFLLVRRSLKRKASAGAILPQDIRGRV